MHVSCDTHKLIGRCLLKFYVFSLNFLQAVVSRGKYGVPAPDGDCWPQMAGTVPLPYSTVCWNYCMVGSFHISFLVSRFYPHHNHY